MRITKQNVLGVFKQWAEAMPPPAPGEWWELEELSPGWRVVARNPNDRSINTSHFGDGWDSNRAAWDALRFALGCAGKVKRATGPGRPLKDNEQTTLDNMVAAYGFYVGTTDWRTSEKAMAVGSAKRLVDKLKETGSVAE